MKQLLRLMLIITAMIAVTGCGTKIPEESGDSVLNGINKNTSTSDTSISETNISNTNDSNKDAILFTFPIPTSNASVDWECGTYYSDITKENLENYLQLLMDDGWKDIQGNKISTEVALGTSEYTLSKEDNLLQIMTFLNDPEVSICNSILIKFDEDISISQIENRKDALSKSEAKELIQENINNKEDQGEIPSTKRSVTGVFEIFIDDAFDKMNFQAYAAISDYGFTGCFLIHYGVVSYVRGNLDNTCVADIDDDGNFELIDLFGWGSGIYRIELNAYEFVNPTFLSSLTELLAQKYHNCFVPNKGYAELFLKKVDDTTVKLVDDDSDYGNLIIKGQTLTLENMEEFPFEEWAVAYDQNLLIDMEKEIPSVPPEIMISIDGLSVDYDVWKTRWKGEVQELKIKDAFTGIIDKDKFVPTFFLSGFGGTDDISLRSVTINFGNSIPDSVLVYDAMLDKQGNLRYNDKLIMERTVKILDNSRVQFNLEQHMALYLSSNMEDYKKDWYRLFRIVCKWGAEECTYVFLINTGMTEVLTKIPNHQFLTCEGSYSALSSSWGLGLSIASMELPEQYIIEWQVSDGLIRSWNESKLKPKEITEQHNGFPATFSEDDNQGAVIWSPKSFDTEEDVTIVAYIYETAEDKSPIAYSKIVLGNSAGGYQKKSKMSLH